MTGDLAIIGGNGLYGVYRWKASLKTKKPIEGMSCNEFGIHYEIARGMENIFRTG